jgi:hypothetical protein
MTSSCLLTVVLLSSTILIKSIGPFLVDRTDEVDSVWDDIDIKEAVEELITLKSSVFGLFACSKESSKTSGVSVAMTHKDGETIHIEEIGPSFIDSSEELPNLLCTMICNGSFK